MKNILTSLGLFLALISFMFYSHIKLNKACIEIIDISENLEELINNEDWEGGYTKAIELIDSVTQSSTPLSLYINHTEFDNISSEAIKLTQYIETTDEEDSLASIHLIKFSAETMLKLQEIRFKNIF